MSVKAKLKVVLQADETVVAEIDDPVLWQRVLTAINKGGGEAFAVEEDKTKIVDKGEHKRERDPDDAVSAFARSLGVERDVVEGACSPTAAEPYMHLDVHCWAAMKDQIPARGPGSMPPAVVAATLLVMWFRSGNLGVVTQAHVHRVLGTVDVTDRNAARGLQNAEWLQSRPGGQILLNAAQAPRATSIVRSFCTKQWRAAAE